MRVDTALLVAWIDRLATLIERDEERLTALDAAIGDADHGINLVRGFTAVRHKLSDTQPETPAALFKLVAMTLIGTVGGASGPLYGTFFLEAGKAVGSQSELDATALREALAAGLAGVRKRGKAELGDKTMIDALAPAVAAITDGVDLPALLAQAATAARQGAKETIPLIARKGRASYLGERSAGHEDPGAASSALLFDSLACVVAEAAK